jgi:hypothetical protein
MTLVAASRNGEFWMLLDGVEDLVFRLDRLDGLKSFAQILWRLPEGLDFSDSNPKEDAKEYLQCAGSADRMVVEIRRKEDRDELVQYCVGTDEVSGETEPNEEVHFGANRLRVCQSEIFDAASALPLFEEYFRTGRIPDTYRLRRLSLG